MKLRIGPGGPGTENPNASRWCTRMPHNCGMIVLPDGTTRARRQLQPQRAMTRRLPGTCMLYPDAVGQCRHQLGEKN